jgi:hypothetical protein
MISKHDMQKLKFVRNPSRMDTLLFESGKKSMTNQILGMNLEVLVVGKDGKAYEKEEWGESNTFRQGEQQNLLVADNRTNDYYYGDPETRARLAKYAWGDKG